MTTAAPAGATLDELCINTIRTLAMDAVQAAYSGHPGTPMAVAPVLIACGSRSCASTRRTPSGPIATASSSRLATRPGCSAGPNTREQRVTTLESRPSESQRLSNNCLREFGITADHVIAAAKSQIAV